MGNEGRDQSLDLNSVEWIQ